MDERTTTLRLPTDAKISLGQRQQVVLLLCHGRGVEAVDLAEHPRISVGRDPGVDVAIEDTTLSWHHARFELVDGEVWVEDLGSTNGVKIDGEGVQRASVASGAALMLGDVSVSMHRVSPGDGRLGGTMDHERFLRSVDAEVLRHRTFERPLTLMMLRPREGGRQARLDRWLPAVQRQLRPIDSLGIYDESTLEVLLPEVPRGRARALAGALAAAAGLRCAVAVYPETATHGAALLDAARSTLQRHQNSAPVTMALPRRGLTATSGVTPVVRCDAMQKVYGIAERMRHSKIPVLITGETGTGKEIIAQAIYGEQPSPLPCVNCGAIPEQLTESVLFGHEKGAFTGADRQTRGLFEEASGGTVFLDEIGELSPAAQVALLRVLDSKKIRRVGSSREIPVDVRVLAATHRDLEAMCAAGTFRQDLLFRINTMTIKIPPLRERGEEIEPLAYRFLAEARELGAGAREGFEAEALELLRRYSWPGNVRELRNVVHRAAAMAQTPQILVDDLPESVLATKRPGQSQVVESIDEGVDFKTRIQRYEMLLIREALKEAGWNKTRAAQRLRIPLRTLIYKLNSFGIRKEAG